MSFPLIEIILRHEGAELHRAPLPQGVYVIGRDAVADVVVEMPQLSRQHARLTVHTDHCLLEDLGSAHGTFFDEQPISHEMRLLPHQSVRLGPDIFLEILPLPPSSELLTILGASSAPPVVSRNLPPELLADQRYAIGAVIAQGGMGAILDARQQAIDRTVAMKVMHDTSDEANVLRFIDEAKITGQLDHPNIVPIIDLGRNEQGHPFYTMKMVRGETLHQVLHAIAGGFPDAVQKYPLPVLLTIFQKVCDALAFAHSKGVIHRDLKPENLMLGDFGSVLVMDWGLAKVIGKQHAPGANVGGSAILSARTLAGDSGSTLAGSIMGTPAYMSPEQARGEVEALDARSDLYSLGLILFEILHLRPAYTGNDVWKIVEKVSKGEVAWNSANPKKGSPVPDSLLAILRKALAFNPAKRYPNVESLQADLLAYQNGFATSAEKAGAWKQFTLFVKRHKAVATSIAAALVLLTVVTAGFTFRVIGEKDRANAALNDLKKQAPALLQLADSEAGFQRFDSALEKLDAALALDPTHLPGYWRRAWLFIGLDRLPEAAAALRLAQQKDPAHAELATILPTVERLAAMSSGERWRETSARQLWDHLLKVGASGETFALSAKLKLSAKDNETRVRQRLEEWLGKGKGRIDVGKTGSLFVDLGRLPIDNIESLRGLPIDRLRETLIKRPSENGLVKYGHGEASVIG